MHLLSSRFFALVLAFGLSAVSTVCSSGDFFKRVLYQDSEDNLIAFDVSANEGHRLVAEAWLSDNVLKPLSESIELRKFNNQTISIRPDCTVGVVYWAGHETGLTRVSCRPFTDAGRIDIPHHDPKYGDELMQAIRQAKKDMDKPLPVPQSEYDDPSSPRFVPRVNR